MNDEDVPFSLGALFTSRHGHLALALLATELIGGMQVFLAGTITPLLAADLHGQHLYGVATASGQIAVFLTMPLGAGLMRRWTPAQLLTWLTPVTVIAGIIGALAPSMWVFILSRVLAGLAAGVVATVGMGAIVTGLPEAWRRIVLASYNLVWLFSSMVGPAYAAWISHALSWRWALVLYLPLLLAARWVIARQLAHQAPPSSDAKEKLPLIPAVVLASGLAILSAAATGGWTGLVAAVIGLGMIAYGCSRVVPAGVVSAQPGARAGLALLGLVSGLVFGADAVAPIIAHDALGFNEVWLGWLLTSMSFCWSAVGLACARWPVSGGAFRRRGGLGLLLIAAGIACMAVATHVDVDASLIFGFAVVGVGMGLVFLDAMNRAFTPDAHEPLAATDAAGAATLAQQVVGATMMTLTTTSVALWPTSGAWTLAALGLLVVPAAVALVRAT